MAKKSIPAAIDAANEIDRKPISTPSISTLLCNCSDEITIKVIGQKFEPLSEEEIAELKQLNQASSNAHIAANRGLEVITFALQKLMESPDDRVLVSVCGLHELLTEIIGHTHFLESNSAEFLALHSRRLLEHRAARKTQANA